jgi:aerobic-type carbon monoxide dehydrogenase small subunit (CoxS/CutS family)
MLRVSLTINGEKVSAEVDPRTLLVKFLREHLRLERRVCDHDDRFQGTP